MSKGIVFVGMSGGVDSSVSAYLLKEQGYTVVGVFIKVWHPDFLPCHWEQERLDAMRVAAHLEIPFLTCNAEAEYKQGVADYFIQEYKRGRTPNPDVMCNTYIKFGHFFAFARAHGATHIATGHYARTIETKTGNALLRGIDTAKDQSYFLWNISKAALVHTLFPIGHLQKEEVRRVASRAKLPTAQKSDSQGICFLGHIDIPSFLSHYIPLSQGAVCTEAGEVIGTHKGAVLYTFGQRHGFTISPHHTHTEPYFVVAKDIEKNTLTVAHTIAEKTPKLHSIVLSHPRWHATTPTPLTIYQCQTRYRQTPFNVTIQMNGGIPEIIPETTFPEIPTEGQSCVLYENDRLVGGGIIETSIS